MADNSTRNLRFDDVRDLHLLVALSGGADSVALLHLLKDAAREWNLRISAAHFHHGIRGADADQDAAFCRELCAGLGVHLIEGRGDVPLHARENAMGLEAAARELRYEFLRSALHDCKADKIALAHHLNDQAETILMHLLRGAGGRGICGMRRMQGELYRPLLEVSKAEITQYLREQGISWREDATNALDDNPRNALRLHVLPEIEKCYPSAAKAIARHGRIAALEYDLLACMTEAFLNERLQKGAYGRRLRITGDEEEAILRRAVRRIIGEPLSLEQNDAVIALAKCTRGKLEISAGLCAEKTGTWLYFLPKDGEKPAPVELKIPGETVLSGICRIVAQCGNFPIQKNDPNVEILDADVLDGAVVRLRQNGDRIHPLGAKGERLLSDYLIDKKIDRPIRNCMPVIAREEQILWAGGAGISHAARIQSNTRRRVRLEIFPITEE